YLYARLGVWDRIHDELMAEADARGDIDWTVSVDATITRAHQHGTNTTRPDQPTGGQSESQETVRGRAWGACSWQVTRRAEQQGPCRCRWPWDAAGDSAHRRSAQRRGHARQRPRRDQSPPLRPWTAAGPATRGGRR